MHLWKVQRGISTKGKEILVGGTSDGFMNQANEVLAEIGKD
jgi:hypothetical protein